MTTLKELMDDPDFRLGETKVKRVCWQRPGYYFVPYGVTPKGQVIGSTGRGAVAQWGLTSTSFGPWELYKEPEEPVVRWKWAIRCKIFDHSKWLEVSPFLTDGEAHEMYPDPKAYELKKLEYTRTEFKD